MLMKFAKFTGKYLCQSLVFNKVEKSLFFKNRPWHRCLPLNFAKFLRTPIFTEHLWTTASEYHVNSGACF